MEEVSEKVKSLVEEAKFTFQNNTVKIKNEKDVEVAVWRVDEPACLTGKTVTLPLGVNPNNDYGYKEAAVSTLAAFYCN